MNARSLVGLSSCLTLLMLSAACGDDSTSEGSLGMSSSEESESGSDSTPTDEAGTADEDGSASASSGDGDGDDPAGDGDGDGDGDDSAGDGDGDDSAGDGDGDDSAGGDGDGDDSGGGDGDGDDETSGDGDGDGESSGDGDGDDTGGGDGDGDDTGGETSGDGDGDGETSGDGDGDEEACQESDGLLEPIPPSVMFLLDRSGSMMTDGFDLDDPAKTRWQTLYEAVEAVVGGGQDATIAFGAKTFSTKGTGACGVSDPPDVEISFNNADGVLAGIPGPLEVVNGGTPTNLALEKTQTIMQDFDASGGAKIIFFITDGAIGCQEDSEQALMDAVTVLEDGYNDDEISTYVVGIAPSNSNANQLQAMAEVGGAPKPGPEAFYRADDAEELNEALEAVIADSYGKSCIMELEEPPFFPDFTKVVIGDTQYSLVDDCDNEDGFIYTNMEFTEIQVCGEACQALGEENEALVQFFCTPG